METRHGKANQCVVSPVVAEVDLRNRQLIYKLDKEKNENLKLSGELRKKSVTSGSANPDPSARPPLPSLRDIGIIPKSTSSASNQQSEQSRFEIRAILLVKFVLGLNNG